MTLPLFRSFLDKRVGKLSSSLCILLFHVSLSLSLTIERRLVFFTWAHKAVRIPGKTFSQSLSAPVLNVLSDSHRDNILLGEKLILYFQSHANSEVRR